MPRFVAEPKKNKGRGGRLFENTRRLVFAQENLCWICNGECPDFKHEKGPLPFKSAVVDKAIPWPNPASKSIDHIIPISQLDADDPRLWRRDNCRLAHLGCNSRRGNGVVNRKRKIVCKTSRNWLA